MTIQEHIDVYPPLMAEEQGRNKTVMIVDDESSISSALTDILEDEGYQVVVVSNGQEALTYFHGNATLPCVILLDMIMPEVSGVEFLNRKQNEAALADIPIIAMSGDFYLAQQTPLLGAADYLIKPFDIEELLATVTRVCS